MEDKIFSGKVVFVTGSSRGIGLATAKKFGLLGAKIAINCNVSEDEMNLAAAGLRETGVETIALLGDVSDYEQTKRMFAEIRNLLGNVDILINNAAIADFGLFTDMTPARWRKITEINQFSCYNCCHLALPSMISKKQGRIINISSVWGNSGASCEAIYSAAKGAVNSFTKALAKETAPSGVFVNAIACGVIDTKMNDRLSEIEREELKNSIALMRFGSPEDVAELAVYLANTDYMIGQVLELDGGFL